MTESRRMRALKRWMISVGIAWTSNALELKDTPEGGCSVKALLDLKEGDSIATIPKTVCLTTKTSGAHQLIEAAGLDGHLGLAVAIMFERSLGPKSPWAAYLDFLPQNECLPLLWTLDELHYFLAGTELQNIVKEDKSLVYDDWEESILPLVHLHSLSLKYFGVEQYFATKTLIASRAFQIDDYHGFGMVPFADLFNHKTGAEDVHITSALSLSEMPSYDADTISINDPPDNDTGDKEPSECSSSTGDDPMLLEMIMVKDVKAGAEVFNTYGSLGNAALLHRYGFTEADNPNDIVNIDLELVLQWCSLLFSGRFTRSRVSLWRKLDYSGCVSLDTEYFEISCDGEPQIELLVLLYILLLPEDAYHRLDLVLSTTNCCSEPIGTILSRNCNRTWDPSSKMNRDLLQTESVCSALLWLADKRESLYGASSINDDIEALKRCSTRERKLYHSLMLRVSERRILEKLRTCVAAVTQPVKGSKNASTTERKRLKRT